jgi:uncharacterized protein
VIVDPDGWSPGNESSSQNPAYRWTRNRGGAREGPSTCVGRNPLSLPLATAHAYIPPVAQNVLGTELQECSRRPLTGFYRSGQCETGSDDVGVHTVCARVTAEFLTFSKAAGNDLSTPMPAHGFEGLQPGDCWCLCAARWVEALEAGVAPPVVLEATHAATLEFAALDDLRRFAVEA